MAGSSPICRNSSEIGAYLGIDKRSIPYYQEEHGLPAWKFEGKGNWKALKTSLDNWLLEMERKNMQSD